MIYQSPIGQLILTTENGFLTGLKYTEEKTETANNDINNESEVIKNCILQLDEYFIGKRKIFDIPVKLFGTEFQIKVWRELQNIPYGFTKTYGYIAGKIGNENASRAVGGANHNNPIAIIVPCHRVIGANNKLTGYGGGLRRKEWLLKHEGVNLC